MRIQSVAFLLGAVQVIDIQAMNIFDDAGDWLGGAADTISDTATDAYNDAGKGLDSAGHWINGAGDTIAHTATDAGHDIGDGFDSAGHWIVGAANDTGDFIDKKSDKFVDGLIGIGSLKAWDKLEDTLSGSAGEGTEGIVEVAEAAGEVAAEIAEVAGDAAIVVAASG